MFRLTYQVMVLGPQYNSKDSATRVGAVSRFNAEFAAPRSPGARAPVSGTAMPVISDTDLESKLKSAGYATTSAGRSVTGTLRKPDAKPAVSFSL